MLVVSKYALDCQMFNSLRWLKTTFIENAFNDTEQSILNSTDMVFALSQEEVITYLGNNIQRKCSATAYAQANGVYVDAESQTCCWWLRDKGRDGGLVANQATLIKADGTIENAANAYKKDVAVRPAMWINLE